MIALSLEDRKEFILPEDRKLPKEKQTVFLLRPLTERSARKLGNLLGRNLSLSEIGKEDASIGGSIDIGDLYHLALKGGLAGWRNLKDKKGNDIEFKANSDGEIDSKLLGHFTIAQRAEVATAVLGMCGIEETDRKN